MLAIVMDAQAARSSRVLNRYGVHTHATRHNGNAGFVWRCRTKIATPERRATAVDTFTARRQFSRHLLVYCYRFRASRGGACAMQREAAQPSCRCAARAEAPAAFDA